MTRKLPPDLDLQGHPDGVMILGADGSVHATNAAGRRLLEADSSDSPVDLRARVAAEDRDALAELLERVFRGESGAVELLVVGTRGGRRWLELTAAPQRDAGGGVAAALVIARDITTRRAREQELRESATLLQEAQELAGLGCFTHDLVTGRLTASDELHAIYGLGREGAAFDCFVAALHPDDRDAVRAGIAAVLRSGETTFRTEYRVLLQDGSVRHMQALGRITRDPEGKPLRLFGAAQDVSASKRAQDALQASEERLRLALEAARIGEWEWNILSGEVRWSPRCLAFYGLPADTPMTYERFLQALHPGDRERTASALRRAVDERATYDEEKRTIWPDGSLHWTASRGQVFCDASGRAVRMLGVTFDITERKLAEEEQARLARVVEQATESIVITDPKGDIVYVNPAFTRLTGYRREEAVGRNPRLLASGHHDASFYRVMWEGLGRGEVWTGRLVNRRKDGSLFEEEATIAPVFGPSGELVNYVGVKRDVTKEAQLERRLQTAERLEALGRLAGGVAHDFNNLLFVIVSYAGLTLRDLASDDPARPGLEHILAAADRASSLTRQLLAFGRGQTLETKLLDLGVLAADMGKLLQRFVREDIEFSLALGPELHNVRADPVQMEQILLNLVVNAADAMPRGGRLTVETANLELDAAYAAGHPSVAPGPYVMLAVSDTGEGMDAETQAHVFEPFFTTKPKGAGSGLGLSIVYGIVKQNGGHISVYSEIGKGTTMKVYLPRAAEESELAPEKRAVTPAASPSKTICETVLVVEDESMVREALRVILEGEGYHVLLAGDGQEALQVAGEHPGIIHLMVSDVVLPTLDGPEVAQRLRGVRPGVRVLFLSGYAEAAAARLRTQENGQGFLSKPFTADALLRRVRAVLDHP